MTAADVIYTGIRELATLARGPTPRTGPSASELGRIDRAALGVAGGRFAYVGPERGVRRQLRLRTGGKTIDLGGASVLPGFVDAHTHALFAGDRQAELRLKVEGRSYAEIAAAGGGLLSTVRATRRAGPREILEESAARLRRMASEGTTVAEVKSGYALNSSGEIGLLELVPELAQRSGLRLVPTFLGAHALPPEFAGRPDAYVREVIDCTLPEVARRGLARFCDVFCEPGYFSVEQSERILRAAQSLGLSVRVHADEFVWSGGARLAARLKATSAEHLLVARPDDYRRLAAAGVTAVLLPVTPFASLAPTRSPGRELLDAGVAVALGTDLSPNSWVESMAIVLSHAVYSARLTPAEAITAATVNAAHAVGLSASAGQISPGRPAEFVAFDVPGVEHVPYRFGARPVAISRQGIGRSSRVVQP